MKLIPRDDVLDQPGLWVNPDWKPGTPGTFAVVIGVSNYTHLDDGAAPTPEDGRPWVSEVKKFGQLHVSALTANRVFTWLADRYRFDEAPLAHCWLLLAPTPKEIPLLSFGGQKAHYADPTFNNCESAIRWWHETMRKQPAPAAPDSRGVFFFSGHGLECMQDRQLLLPTDYLAVPAPNINKAIATLNLRHGTTTLPLNRLIFFIDACRNDHTSFRGKDVTGSPILVEDESGAVNQDLFSPVLFATAPGKRAWEHRDPNKGISIFGQALLDGLAGRPQIELKCSATRCEVELYPLQSYLKARVNELMRNAGSTDRQVVRLGGSPDVTTITYLDPAAAPKGIAGGPRSPAPLGPRPPPSVRSEVFVSESAAAVPKFEAPSDIGVGALWTTDWGEAHRLFGSEPVTELWQKRNRVWSVSAHRWLEPNPLRIERVDRDKERTRFVVRFTIDDQDPGGHVIEFVDFQNMAHACAVPYDQNSGSNRPLFELELDRASNQADAPITRLEVSLAPQRGLIGKAARLWRQYSNVSLGAALKETDALSLRNTLREKRQSPIAATVAALVLLRANRLDQLNPEWLANLANWFPEIPDGIVLAAERATRRSAERKSATIDLPIEDFLHKLAERGVPRTAEAFEYAVGLVERYAAANKDSSFARHLDESLDRVAKHYRPGGLFLSLSGLERGEAPSLFALEGMTMYSNG